MAALQADRRTAHPAQGEDSELSLALPTRGPRKRFVFDPPTRKRRAARRFLPRAEYAEACYVPLR